MGALSTGLPSHHHEDAGQGDADLRLVAADHHSHGTELLEQDDQAPSGSPGLVAAVGTLVEPPAPPRASLNLLAVRPLRPTERAPPPYAPRAPPRPA